MSASGTATRPEGRSDSYLSVADAAPRSTRGEGDCLCWFQRDLPVRLRPSDLHDPKDFHRRLADWLKQQR